MSTSIQGRVVRRISLDMFADITDVPMVSPDGIDSLGLLFDGDLTSAQVEAIWARMTSRDDTDQAARANLATLRAAITGTDPTSLALVAAIDYMLGV